MATDRNLPNVLGTAQTRVQAVGQEVSQQAAAVARAGAQSLNWYGGAGKQFRADCAAAATALRLQATAIAGLAHELGAAKQSAERRIHEEWLAAEAVRKAELAAAQRRAAQQRAGK